MTFTHTPTSGEPSEKPDLLSGLHRTACVLFTILAGWCLLRCFLSFSLAWDDARLFGDLGFSRPFSYYLRDYYFLENIVMFALVTAELALYLLLCRRADQYIPFRGSILYFAVVMAIHVALCIHANTLPRPEFYASTPAEEAITRYYYWATLTVTPSVAYFALYLLRLWKIRTGKDE